MSFTSGLFMGAVASVLFTLAVIIGFPVVSGVLMTVEMLMRGLMETAPNEWEEYDDGYEGPPVNRRKNEAKEGNPGEDRADYPIGDNEEEKREPNPIGIP